MPGRPLRLCFARHPNYQSANKIALHLGYPSGLHETAIDDRRNDPKLIETLKNQGELR